MHVIFSPNHHRHCPTTELDSGHPIDHQEVPARLETIRTAIEQVGWQCHPVSMTVPTKLLRGVHQPAYLKYLRDSQQVTDTVYPSVWPFQPDQTTTRPYAQAGVFCFDMFTPLTHATYTAALESASCAVEAAHLIHRGEQKTVYALGRPPGHHAEPGKAGGYCYLNNAALAAEYLSHFGRVATLDVDFHHGNGTQHIFYDRPDVLTVSIHAHPEWKFPYFSGFETEIGRGAGVNYNRNRTLGPDTTNKVYQAVLEEEIAAIHHFQPAYLVVSFGADTHVSDPIGGFQLTTDYFTRMAQTIAQLNLPTVIVQEGGYNTSQLGQNVVAFLNGFT